MCVTELNRLQTPRLPKPGPCPSLSISHTLRNNPINHFPLLCATISLENTEEFMSGLKITRPALAISTSVGTLSPTKTSLPLKNQTIPSSRSFAQIASVQWKQYTFTIHSAATIIYEIHLSAKQNVNHFPRSLISSYTTLLFKNRCFSF